MPGHPPKEMIARQPDRLRADKRALELIHEQA
jgi:hypothetical protein